MESLDLIWEDPHGLAVNKPAGVLTQPGQSVADDSSLDNMIRRYLRPEDPSAVYLGTIHRLDRPVSGVILWAKTPKAAHRWSAQFAGRLAHKEYWAIVESSAIEATRIPDIWDDWLTVPDRSGQARVVPEPVPGAVRAITRVELNPPHEFLDPGPGFSWLVLRPETGRTHQLRAQASSRGCSILGDLTYGSRFPFQPGIALHARRLMVEHPIRREPMILEASLPTSWSGWIKGS